MNKVDHQPPHTHLNIIEELVYAEIKKQLKHYPSSLAQYLNQIEVATFALNRLPPLYASSEKGKNQQRLLGQRQYQEQIKIAVRQGIAAVQRDPIRSSTPLISEIESNSQKAKVALNELQKLLEERELTNYEKLTWENLVGVMRRALNRVIWTAYQPIESPITLMDSEEEQLSLTTLPFKDCQIFSDKLQ
ncbi:late competence development ComFB family protein [Chroococcus sp. FPU101]|uniref:late competence development ComFB family protein n=1 Tax=Chroococcus sp. FPU101 TaxID=1974212 RepID=UPI001A8D9017|nr:late competence development ComFB family protein [Chroococcus sp. FPU101]GFE68932.1 hypothetical protein CFPU101_15420 [Chroococcus sp. FPU101]